MQLVLLFGDAGDGRLELAVGLLDAGQRGVPLADDLVGVGVRLQRLPVRLGARALGGGAGLLGGAGGGLRPGEVGTGVTQLLLGGGQPLGQLGGRGPLAGEPRPGPGQLLGDLRQFRPRLGRRGLRAAGPLLGGVLRLARRGVLRTGRFELGAQLLDAAFEPAVVLGQPRGQRAGQQLRAVLQPFDDVPGAGDLCGQRRPVPGWWFFS